MNGLLDNSNQRSRTARFKRWENLAKESEVE